MASAMDKPTVAMRRGWGSMSPVSLLMAALAAPVCCAEAAFVASSTTRVRDGARLLAASATRISRAPRARRPGAPFQLEFLVYDTVYIRLWSKLLAVLLLERVMGCTDGLRTSCGSHAFPSGESPPVDFHCCGSYLLNFDRPLGTKAA